MTRPRRSVATATPAKDTPAKEEDKDKDTPQKKEEKKEKTPKKTPPPTKAQVKDNGDAKPEEVTPSAPAGDNGDAATAAPDKAEESPKKAKKAVKKTIPAWATLSKTQMELLAKKKKNGKGLSEAVPARQIIIESVEKNADAKGRASVMSMRKYALKRCPHWPKMTFKTALRKAAEAKAVIQVKGNTTMQGTYKVGKAKEPSAAAAPAKKTKKFSKSRAVIGSPSEPLDGLLPNIFTWVCEPKEASFGLIRKYIAEHHGHLDTEGKMFTKAIERGVEHLQLDRITGKGANGTFQLMDGAKKTGTKYEDAIEDAIIAMNEPKDASIPALRHYLSEYHLEYNVAARPQVLRNALERCEAKGWIKRVTGKGFSGTFRLAFPYYPSPRELWGEWYEEDDEPKPKRKKRAAASSDDDEDSSEEEDSDEEEEDSEEEDEPVYVPRGKRGAPKARKAPPPPKKRKPAAAAPRKRR